MADRAPAALCAPGERIRGAPAVMTDVADPAAALLVDHRLIGAAALQVVMPEERHVRSARSVLRMPRRGESHERGEDHPAFHRASSSSPASPRSLSPGASRAVYPRPGK